MLKYLLFFFGTLSIYAQKEYCFQYDSAGNQRRALLCLNATDEATDEEIKEFLIRNMEIRNEHYISKIQEIAQGNTRIAYMAGKLAIKAQNLSSVSNATELYSIYYDKYLQETDIVKNRNLCKTLSIVSIIRKLDLENSNLITFFLNFFEISNKEFENSIYELEKLEILGLYRKLDYCLSVLNLEAVDAIRRSE